MELHVIGSSSAGNAYVLDCSAESLLIECGLSWSKILRGMEHGIGKCVGCIISHEHGDHAKAVRKVLDNYIPAYASAGTLQALQVDGEPMARAIREFECIRIGGFDVMPFGVQHDAAEPFGYLIRHDEGGTILFATDTYYLKYTFPGITNMMIECNYIQEILDRNVDDGIVSDARRKRTIQSHLSLETLLETLQANDTAHVNNIVLIHLSPDNADAERMQQAVTDATGTNVVVARPGTIVDFNLNPF